MAGMRNVARGDVWKVWYYAAASVLLGAWMSPLLYNAGKALAEVSSQKATNGPLQWLAGNCRVAEFPRFYEAGLLIAALLLFFPWMEWIHARRGEAPGNSASPWLLRLPDGARMSARGQPLQKNVRGLWQACAGFLVVAGLLLSMGTALVPAGLSSMQAPAAGLGSLAFKSLALALVLAFVMEVFFRGIIMGIFLRAMRPAAALGMSAAFFALVLSMIPPAGLNVVDAEASGIGFELLSQLIGHYADWTNIWGGFLPLLALGGVLAYSRWRTGSLWLPVGLHAGWLFAKSMLDSVMVHAAVPESVIPALTGAMFQHGLIPMAAILLAGVLAHYLTANHEDEDAIVS